MAGALRLTVSTFGVIAAIAGIEHGIGAIQQGNQSPDGMVFESWQDSELFLILNGEPALTGILAILASLVLLVWSVRFVEARHGALGLILISAIMLLVGAGFGPPLLGFILGLAATRLNKPTGRWWARFGERRLQQAGTSWPVWYAAGIVVWILLIPGSILLAGTTDLAPQGAVASTFVAAMTMLAFTFLFGSILSAIASDATARSTIHAIEPGQSGSP